MQNLCRKMVRVKGARKPKELRRRRTQPVPPVPTGDVLQCDFNQLCLGSPQQARRPAPSPAPRPVVWHRSSVSTSSVAPPPRPLPKLIQVPEVSSADDEEIQILEELSQPPLAASTPPAPTLPGEVTSTTSIGSSSCPGLDMSEELVWLNNHHYYGAVDVIQEYLDRMNSFGIVLDPWM